MFCRSLTFPCSLLHPPTHHCNKHSLSPKWAGHDRSPISCHEKGVCRFRPASDLSLHRCVIALDVAASFCFPSELDHFALRRILTFVGEFPLCDLSEPAFSICETDVFYHALKVLYVRGHPCVCAPCPAVLSGVILRVFLPLSLCAWRSTCQNR